VRDGNSPNFPPRDNAHGEFLFATVYRAGDIAFPTRPRG
jgi:hypothetical protein